VRPGETDDDDSRRVVYVMNHSKRLNGCRQSAALARTCEQRLIYDVISDVV